MLAMTMDRMHFTAPPKAPKRSLTLWQMLVWAYRDQKVHRYLRNDGDFFMQAAREAELEGPDMPRPFVHPDARIVHARVTELGDDAARLISQFARMDIWPERCLLAPKVLPITDVDRGFDTYGRATIGDKLVDYKKLAHREYVAVPRWERNPGSGDMEFAGYDNEISYEAEYCPFTYYPDPAFVNAHNAVVERFDGYMSELLLLMLQTEFNTHDLLEIEPLDVAATLA